MSKQKAGKGGPKASLLLITTTFCSTMSFLLLFAATTTIYSEKRVYFCCKNARYRLCSRALYINLSNDAVGLYVLNIIAVLFAITLLVLALEIIILT